MHFRRHLLDPGRQGWPTETAARTKQLETRSARGCAGDIEFAMSKTIRGSAHYECLTVRCTGSAAGDFCVASLDAAAINCCPAYAASAGGNHRETRGLAGCEERRRCRHGGSPHGCAL